MGGDRTASERVVFGATATPIFCLLLFFVIAIQQFPVGHTGAGVAALVVSFAAGLLLTLLYDAWIEWVLGHWFTRWLFTHWLVIGAVILLAAGVAASSFVSFPIACGFPLLLFTWLVGTKWMAGRHLQYAAKWILGTHPEVARERTKQLVILGTIKRAGSMSSRELVSIYNEHELWGGTLRYKDDNAAAIAIFRDLYQHYRPWVSLVVDERPPHYGVWELSTAGESHLKSLGAKAGLHEKTRR